MKLSVIIPACNEAHTLEEIVRRVRVTGLVHEILVVDDGSRDGTPEVLARLRNADAPPLQILRHEYNRGKGAAVRTGLAAATGDVVLVQDADLEYDPTDYPGLLAPFTDPAVQAVYGSRNLRSNPQSSFAFYWGGRFLSWTTNLLYGSRLTDEATGYKVVRTGVMQGLGLREDGFEFCPEITGKLIRAGVRIHEVPISYQPRSRAAGKKIRWYHGLSAIVVLMRCRFTDRRD